MLNQLSVASAVRDAYYNLKIMELTLNLIWVCVAIAAVLSLFTTLLSSGAQLRRPESYSRKVIAMGCALVILFFVISMTDDLHNQQVLVEERKGSRIAAVMGAAAHSASARAIPTDFLLFFPPEALSLTLPGLGGLLEPPESLFAAVIESASICGRAPPASLA